MSAYNNVQVGGASNSEAGGMSAYNNVQVGGNGPQHREIGFPIFTDIASWRGHKHRSWRKVSLQ
ncbi:nitrogen regulation protein NIFR3 [Staphylococcus aureus]|uniref:Nitrogen regulation protein NIFR3 n=1 Tax=Staphylococcus aureus TaxID=1280 RepID=A0A380E5S2_STAAU|nr:nitrogen regulation protein NIFR3 [Staphylococcus aureus]